MATRDRLRTEVLRTTWDDLAPHFARGVVLVVAGDLDLLDVGAAIADDDTDAVAGWLAQQRLHRASDADAATWTEASPAFQILIVQPWVVAQVLPSRGMKGDA